MIKTAILVDGGFYRKRAHYFWGDKSPKERADELDHYCRQHITTKENRELYRIFYYDCPPISNNVFHPFLNKTINMAKTEQYIWSNDFFNELKHHRKFALRMGRLAEDQAKFDIKYPVLKKLLSGSLSLSDLSENDFTFSTVQKGVDMKIGVDISSISYKHQVDSIILIAGDSDFVPAAKLARREGIDFILDPMRLSVREDLYEHIDGLRTHAPRDPFVKVTD